jgi:sigma-B regulation protein RsbU (phosphoserine phosphatase)
MNVAMLAREQPELFFTAVYFTLEVETGEIVLASAGHPPPYLRRSSGETVPITVGASGPVGLFEDTVFAEGRFRLHQGDGLIVYTDGITEAQARNGQLYGEERLEAVLAAAQFSSRANELAEQVLTSVARYSTGALVNDDLTLLVCQRRIDKSRSMQPRRRGSGSLAPVSPRV